ncbi:alpha/beta hydrolase [Marinimicrobium alkaliphilum]|uniref:alpha/beta hydrolase n=1 Tax=Marinimicrobium alkaliphilum TaxID=2202654 RepID=UPI000DB9F859|nr:alpha/beta hydrolase [Marinimicrobium alkaliphilum]
MMNPKELGQLLVLSLLLALSAAGASERPADGEPLPLWPEREPVQPDRQRIEDQRIYHVDNPAITPFWPEAGQANGAAMLVFPGGGYRRLAWDKEGTDIADWLTARGIAAFVVTYRMIDYGYPAPQLDGQRAVRYLRREAEQWGLDPNRIGVMGFSAGGHLAGSVALREPLSVKQSDAWDTFDPRPDLAVLAYPVVTLEGEAAHIGSRDALLGEGPDPARVKENSLHHQVTERVPPLFLVHGGGDRSVPLANSLMLLEAVRAHSDDVELHVYPTDVHGFGMEAGHGSASSWPQALEAWLRTQDFIR